jgi:phage tail tape-measure protein
MRELNQIEISQVDGGTDAGDIAMGAAGAWASTVTGAAVGSVVPGVGTVVGAAAGFLLGVAITVGYTLATD